MQAVSEKVITYTNEFKHHFIVKNENGRLPREIFEAAGFDVDLVGLERIASSAKRWRNAYRKADVEEEITIETNLKFEKQI